MVKVSPYKALPTSDINPDCAAQHIHYELARFAIGMLSEEHSVHDRIGRVLGVMAGKCVINEPEYDLDFDGRFLLVEWKHPRDGQFMELCLEMDDLTFEVADRLKVAFQIMAV